jgi:hypothetical protein
MLSSMLLLRFDSFVVAAVYDRRIRGIVNKRPKLPVTADNED